MKNLSLIFIALITLVLNSCSSDDDNRSEYTFKGICATTVPLLGYENQATTTALSTTQLNDLLANYEFTPPVTKGVLYPTEVGTTLKINGLKNGIKLTNFTLNINGITKTFTAEINETNNILYTSEAGMSQFMLDTFNKMVSSQKLEIKATFTPSVSISKEDNISLEVSYSGLFTYLK